MNAQRLVRRTILFTIVVIAYHFALRSLMLHHDLVLGVVRPGTKVYRIVPIYAYFDKHINIWLVVCLIAVVAYLRWVRKDSTGLKSVEFRSTAKQDHGVWGDRFTWKLVAWFLLIVVTVAMLDGGPDRLWRPFDVLHDSDYIGGVESVKSPSIFLRDYVEIRETLPMHCQTHPPGAVLFLWFIDHYLRPGPEAASIVTILFAALSIPAIVGLARLGMGRRRGSLACYLFLLAPNVVLFTATSMEAVFMVPMVWTVYLLFRAFEEGETNEDKEDEKKRPWLHPWTLGLLAGLSASLAAMMTFSVALIAAWAILFGLFVLVKRRDRFCQTFIALTTALCASILFYLLLYLWSGYNLIEMFREAIGSHESIMSGGNYGSLSQYLHLILGNLTAFLVGSGIPISVLYLCSVKQDLFNAEKKFTSGRLLNYTFLATLTITLLAPLYTLEVERIWIFLVPFLTIGAVRCLEKESDETATSTVRLALLLLAAQLITMETFLETLW